MLMIGTDLVGKHDFLPMPCSAENFRALYEYEIPHQGRFINPAAAVKSFDVGADHIPVAFTVFMDVPVSEETGSLSVEPLLTNNGSLKRIHHSIIGLTS